MRSRSGLVVVDMQERLLPAICDRENVLANVGRLAKAAGVLALPTWVTEQYPKGLGTTVTGLRELLAGVPTREKLAFSVCGVAGLMEEMSSKAVDDVILCGIEAHVCVAQSCLDLLDAGLRVFVAGDAVGSRTAANRDSGIDRMRAGGAVIVSTEMMLFELLETAAAPEFKEVQRLVK
jgi:nicotinamidase-related amidase